MEVQTMETQTHHTYGGFHRTPQLTRIDDRIQTIRHTKNKGRYF